ncbi:hypothetical protein CENSYa_0660 [Cenarchaeum symbiosum A]|uniref:GRAM domain-containing protein n=1 Tax=Cenarchaeum symbiosum (strain A) TaxID=414004 RepID=A0RVC6_CENSY|nr:hypothetical protein CENSYa_0660 [Cenarchaeum symbiosum A]
MIVLRNEDLIMRYPAKIKGYGDGVMYITSTRICFESDKKGLCFDLDYSHLFDWTPKKKSIEIRWQELEVGQARHERSDHIFKVEIELKKRRGKKVDPKDVHYVLYYTHTDRFIHSSRGAGWYLNDKEELMQRLYYTHKPQPANVLSEYDIVRRATESMLFEKKTGIELKGDELYDEYMDRVARDSGSTVLEQLIYKRKLMLKAWNKDGTWDNTDGLYTEQEARKSGRAQIHSLERSITRMMPRWIKEDEDLIKRRESGEVDDRPVDVKPIAYNGITVFQGGTVYDRLEWFKKALIIERCIYEIMKDMEFECGGQAKRYKDDLFCHLIEKMDRGEDISNYTPVVEKIPSATIEAKKKIAAYRNNLKEVP